MQLIASQCIRHKLKQVLVCLRVTISKRATSIFHDALKLLNSAKLHLGQGAFVTVQILIDDLDRTSVNDLVQDRVAAHAFSGHVDNVFDWVVLCQVTVNL